MGDIYWGFSAQRIVIDWNNVNSRFSLAELSVVKAPSLWQGIKRSIKGLGRYFNSLTCCLKGQILFYNSSFLFYLARVFFIIIKDIMAKKQRECLRISWWFYMAVITSESLKTYLIIFIQQMLNTIQNVDNLKNILVFSLVSQGHALTHICILSVQLDFLKV